MTLRAVIGMVILSVVMGLELDGEILWPSGSRSPSALMSVLAVQYAQNWDAHRQHSQPYVGREVR
jgi:hypothetical protein